MGGRISHKLQLFLLHVDQEDHKPGFKVHQLQALSPIKVEQLAAPFIQAIPGLLTHLR